MTINIKILMVINTCLLIHGNSSAMEFFIARNCSMKLFIYGTNHVFPFRKSIIQTLLPSLDKYNTKIDELYTELTWKDTAVIYKLRMGRPDWTSQEAYAAYMENYRKKEESFDCTIAHALINHLGIADQHFSLDNIDDYISEQTIESEERFAQEKMRQKIQDKDHIRQEKFQQERAIVEYCTRLSNINLEPKYESVEQYYRRQARNRLFQTEKRNRLWIEKLLKNPNINKFAIFGHGHLDTIGGILPLLHQKGFKIDKEIMFINWEKDELKAMTEMEKRHKK